MRKAERPIYWLIVISMCIVIAMQRESIQWKDKQAEWRDTIIVELMTRREELAFWVNRIKTENTKLIKEVKFNE